MLSNTYSAETYQSVSVKHLPLQIFKGVVGEFTRSDVFSEQVKVFKQLSYYYIAKNLKYGPHIVVHSV